jgi:two-component system cell cycle sensor histidine kinase/response regulator CckA
MAAQRASPRILLVDDEKTVRVPLARLLTRAGYEVLEASTGQDALKLLAEAPVDLLITDLFMQEMGGLELIVNARAMKPRLRIIVMSGETPDRIAALAAPVPLTQFVTLFKPFTSDTLMETVARELSREERGQARG